MLLFTTPAPPTALGRNFSLLSGQPWDAINIAYLNELKTPQTRRAELVRGGGAGGGGGGNCKLQQTQQNVTAQVEAQPTTGASAQVSAPKPKRRRKKEGAQSRLRLRSESLLRRWFTRFIDVIHLFSE